MDVQTSLLENVQLLFTLHLATVSPCKQASNAIGTRSSAVTEMAVGRPLF